MNQTDKRKQSAEREAVRVRNYQRVRARALVRLAQGNPDQYRQYLEEEKAKDEANGRTWLDITGTTANDLDVSLSPHGDSNSLGSHQEDTDKQDEGNVGGEE